MIDPAGGDAERRFLMAGDGVRLHCLHWHSQQSPPSAVLVFLHGIASHAGWFDGLSGEHTTYRAYPGAGHTLDFEPDRTRYLRDMLEWLELRAASASPRPPGGGP